MVWGAAYLDLTALTAITIARKEIGRAYSVNARIQVNRSWRWKPASSFTAPGATTQAADG
jgi:hypothetical protein